MNTPTIRRASLDDAAHIATLVAAAYAPYISRIGQKPAPMLDDYRQLVAQLRVFVVSGQAEILGVLVLSQDHTDLLLHNIAVLPRCKGQGIGSRLMRFCEEQAQASGCQAIRLYTHQLMTENLRFYQKLGYEETHRAREQGFDRVFLRKRLPRQIALEPAI
jgi:ribosomal protein S18 acetylase RimI-like enzyme